MIRIVTPLFRRHSFLFAEPVAECGCVIPTDHVGRRVFIPGFCPVELMFAAKRTELRYSDFVHTNRESTANQPTMTNFILTCGPLCAIHFTDRRTHEKFFFGLNDCERHPGDGERLRPPCCQIPLPVPDCRPR